MSQAKEREEELRRLWADHKNRFKSGAKRASLRGVIKSSYLPELRDGTSASADSDDAQGTRRDAESNKEEVSLAGTPSTSGVLAAADPNGIGGVQA